MLANKTTKSKAGAGQVKSQAQADPGSWLQDPSKPPTSVHRFLTLSHWVAACHGQQLKVLNHDRQTQPSQVLLLSPCD